jgi:TP901 family phage tail tape measure protein
MAVNIGPRIGVEGEQEYRRQMQNIIQSTKTLKSELTATESAFNKNDSAMKRASERAKLLRDAIKSQKEHIQQCADMVDKASQKYGEADTRTLKWKQALADAQTELSRLNGQLAQNNLLTVWGQEVEKLGDKVDKFGQKMSQVGGSLTTGVSTPIVAAGVASTKLATGLEDGMAKVSTIADETEVSMSDMEQSIKDLSDATGIGATDLAEATYQAISAGRSTGEAVGFVADASKLAKSGFTDVTTSVDTLTTILNAYGLSAEDATSISDKLITTQNLGKTTVAELGQSLGTVIPTAAAYGVNIDNVAAAYVAMTKNGVSTAESTTYLNSMINELGKSGTTASNILKEKTGKSFHECMDEGMSFADVLAIVVEGAEESGVELGDMFGNVRAGRAAMNIAANDSKEFSAALEAMGDSAGATDTAFKKVSGTTSAKFNKAINRIKNSGIEAGQAILTEFAPAIEAGFNKVTEATSAFNALSDEEQQNAVKWAAIVAAAGPCITIMGKVTSATGKVISGVGRAAQAIGALSTAIETAGGFSNYLVTALTGTTTAAGLVIGPLAALGAVMAIAGEKSRAITAEQAAFAEEVDGVSSAAEAAAEHVGQVGDSIEQSAGGIESAGSSLSYYQDMLNSCYDAEGNLKEGMEQTAQYALNELNTAMGTDYSTEFVANAESSKAALEEINAAIDTNIAKLKEQAIQQAFQGDYTEALKAQAEAHSALTNAEDTYTEAVQNAKTAQQELNEALTASDATTGKGIERQQKATSAVNRANEALDKAASAYETASEAAAEADAQVSGLDSTMQTLAEGTPESVDKAAEAYANVGTAAEEAGATARAATAETTAQTSADMEAMRQDAFDKIHSIGNEKIKPEVDSTSASASASTTAQNMQDIFSRLQLKGKVSAVDGAPLAANRAKSQMNNIIKQSMSGNVNKVNGGTSAATTAKAGMIPIITSPMQGNVSTVTGGPAAASSAHGQMVPIIAQPMNGQVGSVSNAASAASSAWSTMQSILSRPLSAVVNVAQNITRTVSEVVSRATEHAEGGFVNQEQLSWLAEGNQPEVVIPLSQSKRARAFELYKKTGAILGYRNDEGYLSSYGSGVTTNMGGVTVNVYGAEGQDESKLADEVIDRITNMISIR